MRDRKTASIFHRSQPAWATVSKHHLLGGLKNKYLFLRVMEAKSRIVRAGGQHGWFLGEGSPLPGYSLTQPSLGVCMQRQKTQVGSTFHRGVNSVMRVPPPVALSKLNYLRKAPTPNTITLVVSVSTYELWGNLSIQSIAPSSWDAFYNKCKGMFGGRTLNKK